MGGGARARVPRRLAAGAPHPADADPAAFEGGEDCSQGSARFEIEALWRAGGEPGEPFALEVGAKPLGDGGCLNDVPAGGDADGWGGHGGLLRVALASDMARALAGVTAVPRDRVKEAVKGRASRLGVGREKASWRRLEVDRLAVVTLATSAQGTGIPPAKGRPMDHQETLLDQLGDRLAQSEAAAHEIQDRMAAIEALVGRGMHPEPHEEALTAAGRLLDLARRMERLEAVFEGLERRLAVLEALERRGPEG